MKSNTNISLNLQMPNFSVVVYAVQGDTMSREVTALLYDGQTPFIPSVGALGTVRFLKPDGTSGFYDTLEDDETVAVTWEGNEATIRFAEQVLTVPGDVIVQVSFYNADAERLSTFNFKVVVEKNPLTDEEFESTDYYSVLTARIAAVLGAVAHAPQINELNHWVLWDEDEQDYYDSGVDATGPEGPTGPTGPYMASIAKTSGTSAPGTTDEYQVTLSDGTHPTGTISVYNGSDGQGAPGSATPLMDGTAAVGSATAYSREDHRHPTDTSRASATDVTALQTAATNKVLYFTGVEVTATTGDIIDLDNAAITENHVVVDCVFASPSSITSDLEWTTTSGNLTIEGTCTTATVAEIVLVKKDN